MDFAQSRQNMIDGQLLPNRVTDPQVIAAMSELPRERFLPQPLHGIAYIDEALSIGRDRYALEPNLLARLLQAAAVDADDMCLVVGCGCGYATAVLGRIADTVVAVESDAEMAATASSVLTDLGIDNAVVVEGGLDKGNAKQGPYDVILVNGAVATVPQTLLDQLADGGRLITVLSGTEAVGRAAMYVRSGDHVAERDLFDAGTPNLPGFAAKIQFVL